MDTEAGTTPVALQPLDCCVNFYMSEWYDIYSMYID